MTDETQRIFNLLQTATKAIADSNVWRYFLKTLGDPEIPFKTVITGLQYFLEPVWRCFLAEEEFLMSWQSINAVWIKGDVSKRKMAR